MSTFFRDMGPLRGMMAVVVLILVLSAPAALTPASAYGWSVLPTVVAPALFVIFIFVLPLDVVMTLVFRSDKEGEERARLSKVLVIDVVLTAALALSWTPYILSLLDQAS